MPSIPGLPVSRQDYPAGQGGPDKTIAKVVDYIHDGRTNPLARQFAEGIIQQAGYAPNAPLSNKQVMQAFLDYVRNNVRYRPDAHMTETVQHPMVTLCVPGAAACIPVEDCDGGCCVLGWLATAYGIPVRLLILHFNSDTDHVLLEFQNDDGQWLAADFSNYNSDNMPVGWKPSASSEYRIDPFDGDNVKIAGVRDVEFVAVGKIPRHRKVGALPVVFLGRLPPRKVGIGAVTASVQPFEVAATDLANQVTAVIAAGDTYAVANDLTQALSSYKAAGMAGATSVGPEIDLAGASWVTQPLTHQAWLSNGDLQKITGFDTASVARAKLFVGNMEALWRQAISDGTTALLEGKTAPAASSTKNAVGLVLLIGVLGGIGYAYSASHRRGRS